MRGVNALLTGNPHEANSIFETVLIQKPGDLGAETLRIASLADLQIANQRSSNALDDAPLVVLPALPLQYRLVKDAKVSDSSPLRLQKVSQAKNLIVDSDAWFHKNALVEVSRRPQAEDIPEFVAATVHTNRLTHLFVHPDHQIGVYGEFIGVFAPGKKPRQFDIRSIAKAGNTMFQVVFGQLAGDVLVLQLAYNGYAKESGGKNGYIAAVSVTTGELLWCSDPLVGNAQSFVIAGRHVITGYGFTAEPDFLFVLDLATGKVEEKDPVASGPEEILRKGDELFVRTYDTDLVYRLAPGGAKEPTATLEEEPLKTDHSPPDAETRCLVERALVRIDARDAEGLGPAVELLRKKRGDDTLVKALAGAHSFLMDRAKHPGIDLGTRPVIVVEAPTWEYGFRNGTGPLSAASTALTPSAGAHEKSPTLVKRSEGPADASRLTTPRHVDPAKPAFISPAEKGKVPNGERGDIPSSFGVEDLRAIIPSGDRLILVYGGRYVAIINGTTTEYVLDFEAFLHAPKVDPKNAAFADEDVTYAQVEGTILYVANGGGSYARDVFGKKGFMSAVDLTTGKLVWRSDPLVVDSTFAIMGDFIATGYGFTDEADWVYLLRRDNGRIATKAHLGTAPEAITASGSRIHVEAYSSSYDFDLRP